MKNFLVIVLGLSVAIVIMEMTLRFFPGLLPSELQLRRNIAPTFDEKPSIADFQRNWKATFSSDPYLGYRHRSNLDVVLEGHPDFSYRLQTNGQGFRDDYADEEALVCAVVVGDSFAYGYGVEFKDLWVELLQSYWKCPVVNLGISSFGSERILRTLQRTGWGYRPKLVIWTYFMNDPWDASKFHSWRTSGHPNMLVWEKKLRKVRNRAAPSTSVKSDWHMFLREIFVSYEFLTWGLKDLVQSDSSGVQLCRNDDNIDLVFGFKHLRNWVNTSKPDYIEGQEATKSALTIAKSQAGSRGVPLLVVLFPPKELVYWYLLCDAELDITEHSLQQPYVDMLELCDELKLRCLNLIPILRKYAESGVQLYFREDGHLNSAGNRIVANTIREYTRRDIQE